MRVSVFTLCDYAKAISPATALILKVHQSNFFVSGFAGAPPTEEIAKLARAQRVPFVEDLGSGAVVATEKLGLADHEPMPNETLKRGVGLVCFSGDKLLGGPQAGIIAGKAKRVAALKQEPFFRAVRCDKLVLAALAQLYLQKEPVTCEYRLLTPDKTETNATPLSPMLPPQFPRLKRERWVRDRLAPYYDANGQLAGWEGVIEDITEQRGLAQDLRLTTGILHAAIISMPMGVFFVQGPQGRIILVNARARKLLGQREDLAAGLSHLSQVYRLQKPDGSEYPWEELPVTRALRDGAICTANDIIVHRPHGRRIQLVSWAAPVELATLDQPNAAVWVLEDANILAPKAEFVRRAK